MGKLTFAVEFRKLQESMDAENQKNIRNMVDGQLIVLIVNNEEKLKVEGK